MRSVFVLTYGWLDMPNEPLRETHDSIDSAQASGEAFLASEKRFPSLETAPAYYRIERYNFDVVIAEVKL